DVPCRRVDRLRRHALDHLVSFSCCGGHRDLPSFPTRRSSDLWIRAAPAGRASRGYRSAHRSRRTRTDPRTDPSPCRHLWDRVPRSEEHTSELQSRENLVCRLLLEKKNIDKVNLNDMYEAHANC